MIHRLIGFVLALAIISVGCRGAFDVWIVQSERGATNIYFNSRGLLGDSGVEIEQLQVGRIVADGKRVERVWSIRRRAKELEPIKQITYGNVPQGFEEVLPATALQPGENYDLLASFPGAIGGARFTKE